MMERSTDAHESSQDGLTRSVETAAGVPGESPGAEPSRGSGRASRPTRTVAFMNQKGGVGKTTTTVNIGAAFARLGRRCLMVDLDPQAHCTLHLGIEPDGAALTVYDLLLDPDRTVGEVICRGRDNLDLIPAETSLAAAEVELTTQPGREMILREKIEPVIDQYDYILFDCPPSLGLLTLNALVASREVIIPMQAHFLPLQGVGKLLETVGLVRQRLNRDLIVTGIVLCSHDGQTTLAKEIVADLREFFGSNRPNAAWQDCEIFEPPIRRNIKLAEAPSFGQTIFEYAAWCAGALDYAALSENLLRHWEGSAEPRAVEPPAARSTVESPPPAAHQNEGPCASVHEPDALVAGEADAGFEFEVDRPAADAEAVHDSPEQSGALQSPEIDSASDDTASLDYSVEDIAGEPAGATEDAIQGTAWSERETSDHGSAAAGEEFAQAPAHDLTGAEQDRPRPEPHRFIEPKSAEVINQPILARGDGGAQEDESAVPSGAHEPAHAEEPANEEEGVEDPEKKPRVETAQRAVGGWSGLRPVGPFGAKMTIL